LEKINISSLKNGKTRFEVDIPSEELDIENVVRNRIKGKLVIDKRGSILEIKGEIHYTLRLTCARCLEEFDKNMDKDIHLLLRIGKERILREKALTDEGIDTIYVVNGMFDLFHSIRDIILLSIPMKPLCKDDCKGICPICGKNLNEGLCEHTKIKIRR